jgi:hypothetical protein
VAAVVNVWAPNTHADVFLSRLLDGYRLEGAWHSPRLELVSVFVDQKPPNDMSVEASAEYGFKVYPTIAAALRCGGTSMAVDAVVHIGEHGDYPLNERGQRMYPRREFFEQIVKVMRDDRRIVPLYTDKHFSYTWENAIWMYNTAREMKIPLMAGSTVSLTRRVPPLDLAPGTQLQEAMVVGFGETDAYGFHALEALEAVVEKRRGGETGVSSVQAFQGPEVWSLAERGLWSCDLFEAALSRTPSRVAGRPEDLVQQPVLFRVNYKDGMKGQILICNGLLHSWVFAARPSHTGSILSTDCRISFTLHTHWGYMVRNFENLILTGKVPNPVERTLLTTGILAFAFESLARHSAEVPTPQLEISYGA